MKAWFQATFKGSADDVLALIGISLVAYGARLIYAPAGYIVAGATMVIIALLRAARPAS